MMSDYLIYCQVKACLDLELKTTVTELKHTKSHFVA
jgi:hypothetical protein